jgi:hypothetical protein
MELLDLPDEVIIYEIAKYLELSDLAKFSTSCKKITHLLKYQLDLPQHIKSYYKLIDDNWIDIDKKICSLIGIKYFIPNENKCIVNYGLYDHILFDYLSQKGCIMYFSHQESICENAYVCNHTSLDLPNIIYTGKNYYRFSRSRPREYINYRTYFYQNLVKRRFTRNEKILYLSNKIDSKNIIFKNDEFCATKKRK